MTTDPWTIPLIAARGVDEPRALARDVERGIRARAGHGVYVDAAIWIPLSPEERQVVRIRAHALAADRPSVYSHFSAALLHGLPLIDEHRFRRLDVTVGDPGIRGNGGVAGHVFALTRDEVVERDGVLFTSLARTVIDVAGAASVDEGVVVADAALAARLPKESLYAAIDLAGPRRAAKRTLEAVDFADAGGKSALESLSRRTMYRLGVERPVLQHPVFDAKGHVGDLDFWFPEAGAGGEADGLIKYLDPRYAPRGAGRKLYDEKIRERRMVARVQRLARWGWAEARDTRLLGPVLARVGVRPRRLVVL